MAGDNIIKGTFEYEIIVEDFPKGSIPPPADLEFTVSAREWAKDLNGGSVSVKVGDKTNHTWAVNGGSHIDEYHSWYITPKFPYLGWPQRIFFYPLPCKEGDIECTEPYWDGEVTPFLGSKPLPLIKTSNFGIIPDYYCDLEVSCNYIVKFEVKEEYLDPEALISPVKPGTYLADRAPPWDARITDLNQGALLHKRITITPGLPEIKVKTTVKTEIDEQYENFTKWKEEIKKEGLFFFHFDVGLKLNDPDDQAPLSSLLNTVHITRFESTINPSNYGFGYVKADDVSLRVESGKMGDERIWGNTSPESEGAKAEQKAAKFPYRYKCFLFDIVGAYYAAPLEASFLMEINHSEVNIACTIRLVKFRQGLVYFLDQKTLDLKDEDKAIPSLGIMVKNKNGSIRSYDNGIFDFNYCDWALYEAQYGDNRELGKDTDILLFPFMSHFREKMKKVLIRAVELIAIKKKGE